MQQAEEWKQEGEVTDESFTQSGVTAFNDFSEEASFLVIFHPLLPAGDMSDVLSRGSVACQFFYGPSHHPSSIDLACLHCIKKRLVLTKHLCGEA